MAKSNKISLQDNNIAATKLVVLLHAYTMSPQSMTHVKAAVKDSCPEADIFLPRLPASTFSFADPTALSVRLVHQITQFWEEKRAGGQAGYKEVILVGHSLGGILARKVYLIACGFGEGIEKRNPAPWSNNVERIILLAAMNRGWSISHHMSSARTIAWIIGTWVGNVLQSIVRRPPLIFHIRRGAPFLSNLRLQWLAQQELAMTPRAGKAMVVQLLGSIDDMVGPEDNVDLVTGADFIYLDVPFSGHKTVIDMDDTLEGRGRRGRFALALTASLADLKKEQILPEDSLLPMKRKDVTDVIFVIHGIRDLGYWTQKIARRIIALGKGDNRVYQSETATYGYFPLAQ